MSYTQQWRRCNSAGGSCVDIPGETGTTYTTVDADDGKTLRVKVTRDDGVSVVSDPTGIIGATPLVPDPPGSYAGSGSVVATQLLASMGGSGPGLGQGTFHPNYQHLVAIDGVNIFAAYNYHDNNDHETTHFRLDWSDDQGATFTTIYDSADNGSDPDYGMGPALEMDAAGNLYMLVNHYPRGGSSSTTKVTYIHKFAAPYNQAYTHANTVIGSIAQASNKWSVVLDQTRQWIWICFWQDTTAANLYAVDLSGSVVYSKNIFNVKPGVELYATATYPCLTVANDGALIVGWTAESSELLGLESFYSPFLIVSRDGGATFKGPNGTITLPVYADDSGPAAKTAWKLAHAGVDFLAGSDGSYGSSSGHYNWNHLNSLAVNSGKIHAHYEYSGSPFGGQHAPYVRMDRTSGLVDVRREPVFNGDDGFHLLPGNTGAFAQSSTQVDRLYFVGQGRADQGNLGKFAALFSDNPGAATPVWAEYAVEGSASGTPSNGLVNIGTCRAVQPDGAILAMGQQADSPNGIYFARFS